MKNILPKAFFAALLVMAVVEAMASTSSVQLGNGWVGLTKQSDPFDKSAVEIIQMFKGNFTFRCGELNMSVGSYGFESLSFGAELQYVIDDNSPNSKKGKYSTYLGGSDLVTDSRYFSFKLTDTDVSGMKTGLTMKVAGKYGQVGWKTKSLDLKGFASAYSEMCG